MIDKNLVEQIASVVKDCGYQLWACDHLAQGKHSLLRVYIDHPDGIGLKACEQVSRQISALMDVEDPISGTYSLEVSSPGQPRPLFYVEHYQQFIGKSVALKLMRPLNKKRKITGVIEQVDDNENIILSVGGETHMIPLSNIVKAQLTD